MGKARTVEHNFYCIACGNKGIPLARKMGKQREKFHRKKLFCLTCGKEVNHIECRNQEEIDTFKRNFEKGVYADEAKQEIVFNVWA